MNSLGRRVQQLEAVAKPASEPCNHYRFEGDPVSTDFRPGDSLCTIFFRKLSDAERALLNAQEGIS